MHGFPLSPQNLDLRLQQIYIDICITYYLMKVQDENQKTQKKEPKPLDPRLLAGPLADRSCTDILCLLLFIASFCLMWAIAITGYSKGTPSRLAAAYDPDKKACGLDYPDYPYIYFPILHPDYYNYTTCVKECPSNVSLLNQPSNLECETNKLVPSCNRNCLDFDFNSVSSLKKFTESPDIKTFFCIYSTSVLWNRLCFPEDALTLLNQTTSFSESIDIDRMTAWINDLNTAKWMILGSFFIAFVLGLIYMVLVRYLAGIIVWLSILFYFVALIILGVYCYTESKEYEENGKQTTDASAQTNAADTAQALLITSYVILAWFLFCIMAFICMFNKIRLAIAVIKTATLFVRDNFLIILVPPVIAIVLLILWIWWIISVVYIVALGKVQGTGQTPFASVEFDETTRRMFWYFVFGGLWKNAFLLALCQFIIGSSVCIWYFSQGPGQASSHPIATSIYRAFRYHLGSLAFGSLILAIVQFIRIILAYMKWQAQHMGGENKVTKCILDCLQCYVACFERFIEFLNKNAYIEIALTGKSFCPAAKEAFETIWANAGRYSLVAGIGGAFNFVGKLCITIITVMIAYLILTNAEYYTINLISPVLPCIIIFVIAYAVSILFMSIYSMACDTVLTCYIYDEDLNKQTGGGSAQHCPETLREFFELNNK